MKRFLVFLSLFLSIIFSFGIEFKYQTYTNDSNKIVACITKILCDKNDSNVHVIIPNCVQIGDVIYDVERVGNGSSSCYSGKAITGITFPAGLKTINHSAFRGCTSLKDVRFLPKSNLKQIKSYAFADCGSLRSFVIPPTEEFLTINDYVFKNCNNLEELVISDGMHPESYLNSWIYLSESSINSLPLKRVYIGRILSLYDYLNFVDEYTISGENIYPNIDYDFTRKWINKTISTIDVGKNLSILTWIADRYLRRYQTINFRSEVPPILESDVFDDVEDLRMYQFYYPYIGDGKFTDAEFEKLVINVPCGSLANYRSHPVWGKFLHINEVDFPDDEPLAGDVSGDGRVNVSDVAALINQILGIESLDIGYADVNGDGRANVSDVAALINIILGITSEPESLTVSPISANLYLGDTLQMEALLRGLPKNAEVEWSSTSPKVATVDSHGMLRTSSAGEALIIARVPGQDAGDTCHVTVSYKDDYSIKLDRKQLYLYEPSVLDSCYKGIYIGSGYRSFFPEHDSLYVLRLHSLENQGVIWSSSDTSVVAVTQDGLARMTGVGHALITVSLAQDSLVSTSCEVFCLNNVMKGDECPRHYISDYPIYYAGYEPPFYFSPDRLSVREGEVFSISLNTNPYNNSFLITGDSLGRPIFNLYNTDTGEVSYIHSASRAWTFKAVKPGKVSLWFHSATERYAVSPINIYIY
jgi:hypothetical protein